MESHPFYLENKERFLNADQLLMVFPLFWYSVPGILKTWIDMINTWAYQYESGRHAKAKHKIKQVLIIYAAMQDHGYMKEALNNPVEQQLKETCKFIGIENVDVYVVDNVTKITPSELEQHLQKVKKFCKK